MKRMPRRSLFMEEMAMPLPKPHATPEKMTMIPDMNEDHLASCLAKTQDLIQDTINNLFSTTERLTTMKNSIKATDDNGLENIPPRSVLELQYKLLEMRFMEATAHNVDLVNTVQELLEEQENLRNGRRLSDNASELKQQLNLMRAECDKLQKANTQMKNEFMRRTRTNRWTYSRGKELPYRE